MSDAEEPKAVDNLSFKWGIKKGVGGKNNNVHFYESFTYEGVEYFLYDSVVVYQEGDLETSIGKLVKIYETPSHAKKVKIVWFFRPIEIRIFLNDYKPGVNELFLGSGVGSGLFNINPLESIRQKCNVLCASNDQRNPQVSEEELSQASYIFYRTFDVGKCKIEESFPEEIAGVKVENFFNRKKDQALVNNLHVKEDARECAGESSSSSRLGFDVAVGNAVKGGNSGICLSPGVKESQRAAANMDKQGYHPSGDTALRPTTSVAKSRIERSFVENSGELKVEHCFAKKKDKALANLPKSKAYMRVGMGKPNLFGSLVVDKGARVSRVMKVSRNDAMNMDKQGHFPSYNTTATPKSSDSKYTAGTSSAERKGRLKVLHFAIREKDKPLLNNSNAIVGERTGELGSSRLVLEKAVGGTVNVGTSGSKESPVAKELGKVAINGDKPVHFPSDATTLRPKTSIYKGGTGPGSCSQVGDRAKVRYYDNIAPPSASDIPFKKRKILQDDNACEEFANFVHNKGTKTDSLNLEAARRPNSDRSSWFKQLPLEEKLQRAHELGKLVSLENLDPSYTSSEVEDLVWHEFHERVEAKMLHRNTFSSPHSGKALVMFKSKDAADLAISNLRMRCLMLADGRPIVGSRATFSEPGKSTRYTGHLIIDKIRLKQHEYMKKAVSTSHCSQPNTIEYDMAIQWCVLQKQSDEWWKALYEKQEKERHYLRSQLKMNLFDQK